MKTYRVYEVTGDRYAGEWPREAFRAHGVRYNVAALNRSELYLELLPTVNAAAVELLDDPKLLRELRGLERRRGVAGKDRVDHRSGEHDDRANAIAGVVAVFAKEKSRPKWGLAEPGEPRDTFVPIGYSNAFWYNGRAY